MSVTVSLGLRIQRSEHWNACADACGWDNRRCIYKSRYTGMKDLTGMIVRRKVDRIEDKTLMQGAKLTINTRITGATILNRSSRWDWQAAATSKQTALVTEQ